MDLKEKINTLWPNPDIADEIEKVLNENDLSLDKLITCCSRKKQNVLSVMGAVLAMNDLEQKIIQCECGEIMFFNEEIYSKNPSTYGDDKILCKRCDPNFTRK